jgi:hypothetical protein
MDGPRICRPCTPPRQSTVPLIILVKDIAKPLTPSVTWSTKSSNSPYRLMFQSHYSSLPNSTLVMHLLHFLCLTLHTPFRLSSSSLLLSYRRLSSACLSLLVSSKSSWLGSTAEHRIGVLSRSCAIPFFIPSWGRLRHHLAPFKLGSHPSPLSPHSNHPFALPRHATTNDKMSTCGIEQISRW